MGDAPDRQQSTSMIFAAYDELLAERNDIQASRDHYRRSANHLNELRLAADDRVIELLAERDDWQEMAETTDRRVVELERERDKLQDIVREAYLELGPPQPGAEFADVPSLVAAVVNERDKLIALSFTLYRTLYDGPIEDLAWLTPDAKALLARVVRKLSPSLNPNRHLKKPAEDP